MKNRQYTSLIETRLFQCRSYTHWRRINVDQAMFQPCILPKIMFAGSFSFLSISVYLLIETLLRHVYKHFLLLLPTYCFLLNTRKQRKIQ